ncbi:MAG: ThuA domain-containing protein [Candidatus Sumerlaeaceae bacterium]
MNANIAILLALGMVLVAADAFATGPAPETKRKVLVYTRNHVTNGKGFVHDNIAESVAAVKEIGAENGFDSDVSDDPNVFTEQNLKQYAAIVFSNSNNEAFETVAQRDAFRRYIRAGGGFVGIHSASGSEREWPWFWSLLGGKFRRHPKLQPFEVRVVDADHPATKDLPTTFTWTDECYYLDNLNNNIKPLLVTDPSTLEDPKLAEYPGTLFGNAMPIAWYHEFEGGRSFYTALGHKKEHYQDPFLVKQIAGGILWAMEGSGAKVGTSQNNDDSVTATRVTK